MNRNEAREQAFLLLFSECFHEGSTADEIIKNASDANDFVNDDYTLRLLSGVIEHKADIDKTVSLKLKNWKLERLPKTTLAILRLAVYEIVYCDDIPDSVAINEAVNLAKRFGSQKDYSFINGILGAIAREQA